MSRQTSITFAQLPALGALPRRPASGCLAAAFANLSRPARAHTSCHAPRLGAGGPHPGASRQLSAFLCDLPGRTFAAIFLDSATTRQLTSAHTHTDADNTVAPVSAASRAIAQRSFQGDTLIGAPVLRPMAASAGVEHHDAPPMPHWTSRTLAGERRHCAPHTSN